MIIAWGRGDASTYSWSSFISSYPQIYLFSSFSEACPTTPGKTIILFNLYVHEVYSVLCHVNVLIDLQQLKSFRPEADDSILLAVTPMTLCTKGTWLSDMDKKIIDIHMYM